MFRADLADREQTIRAVAGSTAVHLIAGLKYNLRVWQELWPRIMANTIEACKRAEAKLIFFDKRPHVWQGRGPDDGKHSVRSLLEEGRDPRKDRNCPAEWGAGWLSERNDRALSRFLRTRSPKRVPNVLVVEPFCERGKSIVVGQCSSTSLADLTPDPARSGAIAGGPGVSVKPGVASADGAQSTNR